jgi:hypothetical protein
MTARRANDRQRWERGAAARDVTLKLQRANLLVSACRRFGQLTKKEVVCSRLYHLHAMSTPAGISWS